MKPTKNTMAVIKCLVALVAMIGCFEYHAPWVLSAVVSAVYIGMMFNLINTFSSHDDR